MASLECASGPIATALPEPELGQERAAELARAWLGPHAPADRWLGRLYRRTGVSRRRLVAEVAGPGGEGAEAGGLYRPALAVADAGPGTGERMRAYERAALPLATRAAASALAASGVRVDGVTHLVTVSCTGFAAPGIDVGLMRALALPPTTERVGVGFMGCHGAINGLRAARAFALADPGARVLLCALELCSLHFQYSREPEMQVANALFGDGAAATVIGPATARAPVLRATASRWLPGTEGMMSWRISDHGFVMSLSPQVPALVKRHLPGWLRPWLAEHGFAPADIAGWAIHPGGPRVLEAAGEGLELPEEALAPARAVLAEHGNMSSPTVLFVLERLHRVGATGPCVLLAFGPGLTMEAALFHLP